MKKHLACGVAFFSTLAAIVVGVSLLTGDSPSARAAEEKSAESAPAPVEDDMHEFMEYYFQPVYKRLKAAMAAAPENNQGWKTIKSDGLILAEGGNLLMIRGPEDDAAAWKQYSADVRELGGRLYQAGKQKDFKSARQQYTAMLMKCNACHQKFAGGEHQLQP